MNHPDEMTMMEQFTILQEENPAMAEALLDKAQEAAERIQMAYEEISTFTVAENGKIAHHSLGPVPHNSKSLGAVAAQYGALFERYMAAVDILNRVLAILSYHRCEDCAVCQAAEDEDEDE